MELVFTREEMGSTSVTGRSSNSAQQALDPANVDALLCKLLHTSCTSGFSPLASEMVSCMNFT